MDCAFCEIVAGTAPAHVVWEDSTTVAFLDIAPSADGHTLVVPKVHAADGKLAEFVCGLARIDG